VAAQTIHLDPAALAEAEARAEAEAAGYALPLVVQLAPVIELSRDQFFEFCQLNRDLRIERNAKGELLIMPPAGGETGRGNAGITAQLWVWAKQNGTGVSFDSSTGFTLPNGAERSPDAAWIRRSRWDQLSLEERQGFAPICSEFVIELRSPTGRLRILQAKMQEYLDNGVRLGWLIDPIVGRVHVYRPGAPIATLTRPETLSGDPLLPGFVLDLREIWQPG
jgi:Uma2 family endonuclease